MARPSKPSDVKVRHGWKCAHCGCITLEFRGSRVTFCPSCKGSDWEAGRYVVYIPTEAYSKKGR